MRHCEELHLEDFMIPVSVYAILWQSTIVRNLSSALSEDVHSGRSSRRRMLTEWVFGYQPVAPPQDDA